MKRTELTQLIMVSLLVILAGILTQFMARRVYGRSRNGSVDQSTISLFTNRMVRYPK